MKAKQIEQVFVLKFLTNLSRIDNTDPVCAIWQMWQELHTSKWQLSEITKSETMNVTTAHVKDDKYQNRQNYKHNCEIQKLNYY